MTTTLHTDSGLGAVDWRRILGNAAGMIADGREGRVVTEAVILAGYATYGPALRAAYEANPAAIDAWARQIDLQRVIDSSTTSDAFTAAASRVSPWVLLGSGLAAGLLLRSLL